MNHRLAPYLLGLLLVAAAGCANKKDAAPTLEGTWTHERATLQDRNPDGTLGASTEESYPAGQRQLTLTATQWIYRNSALSTSSTSEYTRQDNTLSVWRANAGAASPTRIAILELTAHRLHLQTSAPGAGSQIDDYYTR